MLQAGREGQRGETLPSSLMLATHSLTCYSAGKTVSTCEAKIRSPATYEKTVGAILFNNRNLNY
jgi:hypothetical protein